MKFTKYVGENPAGIGENTKEMNGAFHVDSFFFQ